MRVPGLSQSSQLPAQAFKLGVLEKKKENERVHIRRTHLNGRVRATGNRPGRCVVNSDKGVWGARVQLGRVKPLLGSLVRAESRKP